MADVSETTRRIKEILRTSLKLDGGADLADDTPLAGGEFDLDSLDILLAITEIEKQFGVKISDRTMDPKAFASVHTLAEFVLSLGPTR